MHRFFTEKNSICILCWFHNPKIMLYFWWICRFSLDNIIKTICWVLHNGLGQFAQVSPTLLHQLCIFSWRIFPDGYLQLRGLQKHHSEPWPSLHYLGYASEAASQVPRAQRFPKNGPEQPPVCQKVQEEHPSSWQNWSRSSEEAPEEIHVRGLVFGERKRSGMLRFPKWELWCFETWSGV